MAGWKVSNIRLGGDVLIPYLTPELALTKRRLVREQAHRGVMARAANQYAERALVVDVVHRARAGEDVRERLVRGGKIHLCSYASGSGKKRKLCLQEHRKCEAHSYGKSTATTATAGATGATQTAGATNATVAAAGTSATAETAPNALQTRLNALAGRR